MADEALHFVSGIPEIDDVFKRLQKAPSPSILIIGGAEAEFLLYQIMSRTMESNNCSGILVAIENSENFIKERFTNFLGREPLFMIKSIYDESSRKEYLRERVKAVYYEIREYLDKEMKNSSKKIVIGVKSLSGIILQYAREPFEEKMDVISLIERESDDRKVPLIAHLNPEAILATGIDRESLVGGLKTIFDVIISVERVPIRELDISEIFIKVESGWMAEEAPWIRAIQVPGIGIISINQIKTIDESLKIGEILRRSKKTSEKVSKIEDALKVFRHIIARYYLYNPPSHLKNSSREKILKDVNEVIKSLIEEYRNKEVRGERVFEELLERVKSKIVMEDIEIEKGYYMELPLVHFLVDAKRRRGKAGKKFDPIYPTIPSNRFVSVIIPWSILDFYKVSPHLIYSILCAGFPLLYITIDENPDSLAYFCFHHIDHEKTGTIWTLRDIWMMKKPPMYVFPEKDFKEFREEIKRRLKVEEDLEEVYYRRQFGTRFHIINAIGASIQQAKVKDEKKGLEWGVFSPIAPGNISEIYYLIKMWAENVPRTNPYREYRFMPEYHEGCVILLSTLGGLKHMLGFQGMISFLRRLINDFIATSEPYNRIVIAVIPRYMFTEEEIGTLKQLSDVIIEFREERLRGNSLVFVKFEGDIKDIPRGEWIPLRISPAPVGIFALNERVIKYLMEERLITLEGI